MFKIYHKALMYGPNGAVSALCSGRKTPKPINMEPDSDETWTTDNSAVTCPACLKKLKGKR